MIIMNQKMMIITMTIMVMVLIEEVSPSDAQGRWLIFILKPENI